MAASTGIGAKVRKLDDVAARCTAMANEREVDKHMETLNRLRKNEFQGSALDPLRPEGLGIRPAQVKVSNDLSLRGASVRAPGMPLAAALKMATEAVRPGYVLPETILHSVVATSIISIAYELIAYGKVPPEVELTAPNLNERCAHKVLVVDDTADVLVAVGAFLVGEGFAVVSAADGDNALELIGSDPQIGALVTDYAMPGLSGVDLIAQAAQLRPDLKALLITAYPNAEGLAELPSHIRVLIKPFRRAALITQIRSLLSDAPPLLPDEAMELVHNRPD